MSHGVLTEGNSAKEGDAEDDSPPHEIASKAMVPIVAVYRKSDAEKQKKGVDFVGNDEMLAVDKDDGDEGRGGEQVENCQNPFASGWIGTEVAIPNGRP